MIILISIIQTDCVFAACNFVPGFSKVLLSSNTYSNVVQAHAVTYIISFPLPTVYSSQLTIRRQLYYYLLDDRASLNHYIVTKEKVYTRLVSLYSSQFLAQYILLSQLHTSSVNDEFVIDRMVCIFSYLLQFK